MPFDAVQQNSKLTSFLKRHAPYSVIDSGIALADAGHVVECSRSGSRVYGTVREEDGENFNLTIEIASGNSVKASCSCSSQQEMDEQWCPHAVALTWRAFDLEFFKLHSGFASTESAFRMNTSSPREIAEVIRSTSILPDHQFEASYLPKVSIHLLLGMDRLGVQVQFDGEVQEPIVFEAFSKKSSRALDNFLLQILDEHGAWDEHSRVWFISSSTDLEFFLSLIGEYQKVVSYYDGRPIRFADSPLQARLEITWLDGCAELAMQWIFPDDSVAYKQEELLGTGPYWTVIEGTVYRLAPAAARIASIFPHSNTITLSRSHLGPVVEAVTGLEGPREFLAIKNVENQPETAIKSPVPVLELVKREHAQEHFAPTQAFEIGATFEFSYPTPPSNRNIVYLPNREEEQAAIECLKGLGFRYHPDQKRYVISGDSALDLLERGLSAFPEEWRVEGLSAIQSATRFATLAFDISVSELSAADSPGLTGTDWFDCRVSLTQNNANVPISSLFKNAREGFDKWIRLDSGAYARVPGGGIEQLKKSLGLLSPNYRLSNNLKSQISTAQAIGISRLEDDRIRLSLDKRLRELGNRLRDFQSIAPVKPGRGFDGELRSYQLEGLSWLKFLSDFGLGGILADEMGLGKTVQTLAYLHHQKLKADRKRPHRPSLVVAPTSVVMNWVYEAKRFTPSLKVLLLHGPGRKADFERIAEHDLVITSYALLRIDRQDLSRQDFGVVVLDEAQNIKNPQAATTRAAKALRSEQRLALTGTPTENRPLELWSIFDFLMPGYLGTLEFFKSNIERPILEEGANADVAHFLSARTRPFLLRRTKAEVERDLPEKIESELHVGMTASQETLYRTVLAEVRPQVMEAVRERGVRGATVSILAALLRLRQICNHPNSIEAFREMPGFDSGKFELLKELVSEALTSNRKILVFSQFREMLAIIRRWLDEQDFSYLYLDGTTKNRHELIDRFNSDEGVRLFLISLKAGGTGLNLTAADTVIIYDPWWNPAVEAQAVDRAHRIGQTKNVTVYRLVTENSIEQKIMDLKSKKEKIIDVLIDEKRISPLRMTKAELEQLFSPLPEELG